MFLRLAEHYAWTERSSSKVFDFSRIFSLIFSKFFFSPRTDVSSFSICTNLLHLAMYSSPDGAFFLSISNFAFFSITFCYFFKNNYFNFYMKKLREKKTFPIYLRFDHGQVDRIDSFFNFFTMDSQLLNLLHDFELGSHHFFTWIIPCNQPAKGVLKLIEKLLKKFFFWFSFGWIQQRSRIMIIISKNVLKCSEIVTYIDSIWSWSSKYWPTFKVAASFCPFKNVVTLLEFSSSFDTNSSISLETNSSQYKFSMMFRFANEIYCFSQKTNYSLIIFFQIIDLVVKYQLNTSK